MTIVTLIPALLCAVFLFVWPIARVFRTIVLPTLLLCPMIYFWKLALLPPIDFADAVLLPLGIAMCLRSLRRWRFSWLDLAMVLFLVSTFWADRTLGKSTTSTFELFDAVCTFLVPYMAGKLLIEQDGGRLPTLRRMVALLFGAGVVASLEFFFAINPWERLFANFFPQDLFSWTRQFRGGHARVTGPFWQAELAGTMFMIGVLLAMWLARYANWGPRFRSALWIPFRKSTVVVWALVAVVFLTQSRGPELGLLFAAPVALIGRSRRVLRSTLLALVFLGAGGAVAYTAIMNYAATKAPTGDEQQTAMYRAVMITKYVPMAEHSGPWGLGPQFPRFGIYISIDNEYLLLALVQGWIGLGTFLLIGLGMLYNLVWVAIYNPEKADRAFAFTLLGIVLGMLVIVATVFLGYQTHMFFFLMAGWAQTLKRPAPARPQPAFERVFT